MNTITATTEGWDGCPFPFFDEQLNLYKIYNDGGHYIATRYVRSQVKPVPHETVKEDIDILFDGAYRAAMQQELCGDELSAYIKTELEKLFADRPDLDDYISDKIDKARRNLYARKKRFRRKGYLNRWNYFFTLT